MIFNTLSYYLLFLIPAAILFRLVPSAWRSSVCALLGAAFFVFFSITQVGGSAGALCLSIFIWESLFSRLYRSGSWLCWVGVGQAIVFLGVFKYWNFLTGLAFTGANPLHWEGAFLPLGISFFTFEFILFFPTMVAGPIKRYQDFVPTLQAQDADWVKSWHKGITRILTGLVKKFAIADLMTAFTDHLNHADIAQAERWILPVWLLAFGIKIYFDFSAYSDIAIGSARLFGLSVKENFDWPYFRTNIALFWQHWHISLYRWLVDYVFIPLGGSRVSTAEVYRNVLLTMLLSGLWHGAGLNFLAWGLWHGGLLCIHRAWSTWRGPQTAPPSWPGKIAGWALTFVAVNLGWAFFVMDLKTATFFLRRLFLG